MGLFVFMEGFVFVFSLFILVETESHYIEWLRLHCVAGVSHQFAVSCLTF